MIDYKILKQKLELLSKSTVVLISGHTNADYDSICSSLALAHILTKLGYTAYALIEEKDMYKTDWLDTSLVINSYSLNQPFNFIIVDSPRKERLGSFETLFDQAETTLSIDHHDNYKAEANYTFVDQHISSTSEIIATLAQNLPNLLDKNIATLLYAGISSDTNSFYRRVNPSTMRIASMLLQYNVDNAFVIKHTCRNMTLREASILSYMLSNIEHDTFHYVILSRKDSMISNVPYSTLFKKCASFIYDLSDIKVFGLFLIEFDGSISGLLRSNCDIDVDILAKDFGGGGHKKAAGFENNMNIEQILFKVKEHVKKYS